MIPPCVAVASHGSYIGVEASPQALWSRHGRSSTGRSRTAKGDGLGEFGVASEPNGRLRGVDRDAGVADHHVLDGVVGAAEFDVGADGRYRGIVHLDRLIDVVVEYELGLMGH